MNIWFRGRRNSSTNSSSGGSSLPTPLAVMNTGTETPMPYQQEEQQQTTSARTTTTRHEQPSVVSPKRATSNKTRRKSSSSSSIPLFVMKATSIAGLGGILFGYDLGVISGALPQLETSFDLTSNEKGIVVGILYLGSGIGATVGGWFCDAVGRKMGIFATDFVFVIGALLLYFARSLEELIVGRIVVGIAISVSGIADVAYLHEIAPPRYRGAIVSVNEACISLGFLLAFGSGMVLEQDPQGWRTMFGISGILAALQAAGMIFMPESPVWLKLKGREHARRAALHQIYGSILPPELDVSDNSSNINDQHESQESPKSKPPITGRQAGLHLMGTQTKSYETLNDSTPVSSDDPTKPTFLERLRQFRTILSRHYRQVWISVFLSSAQQFCGQMTVLNYASEIFTRLNGSGASSSLWIGIVKFIATVLVIWKIEDFGRRTLLLTGIGVIMVGQCLVAIAFSLESTVSDTVTFLWAMPGTIFVAMGYSMSYGPLTWLLTSEIFPSDIRGRALGASTIINYLCAAIVTTSFLPMQSILGDEWVFILYMSVALLSMVFVYLAIPDTGSMTVEEIDVSIQQMWWWRRKREQGLPTTDDTFEPQVAEGELT